MSLLGHLACTIGLHEPYAAAFQWAADAKRGDLPTVLLRCRRCGTTLKARLHPARYHPDYATLRWRWEASVRQAGPHRGGYPGAWLGLDGSGDQDRFGPLVPPRGASAVGHIPYASLPAVIAISQAERTRVGPSYEHWERDFHFGDVRSGYTPIDGQPGESRRDQPPSPPQPDSLTRRHKR